PEVDEQLDLPLGLAAAEGDDRQAESLGAIVGAQSAREEPVAVADMDDIVGAGPRRADRASDDVRPGIDVARGIADHGGLAGRAARCVDANDLFAVQRKHPEGIVGPQVRLGSEPELAQVVERAQVVGMYPGGVEGASVLGNVAVGSGQAVAQALEQERAQFIEARMFDRLERQAARGYSRAHLHGSPVVSPVPEAASAASSVGTNRPLIVALRPRNSAMRRPSAPVTRT